MVYTKKLFQLINSIFGRIVRKQSLSFNPVTQMFECSDGRGKTYTSGDLMDGLSNDKKWKKIK